MAYVNGGRGERGWGVGCRIYQKKYINAFQRIECAPCKGRQEQPRPGGALWFMTQGGPPRAQWVLKGGCGGMGW